MSTLQFNRLGELDSAGSLVVCRQWLPVLDSAVEAIIQEHFLRHKQFLPHRVLKQLVELAVMDNIAPGLPMTDMHMMDIHTEVLEGLEGMVDKRKPEIADTRSVRKLLTRHKWLSTKVGSCFTANVAGFSSIEALAEHIQRVSKLQKLLDDDITDSLSGTNSYVP